MAVEVVAVEVVEVEDKEVLTMVKMVEFEQVQAVDKAAAIIVASLQWAPAPEALTVDLSMSYQLPLPPISHPASGNTVRSKEAVAVKAFARSWPWPAQSMLSFVP